MLSHLFVAGLTGIASLEAAHAVNSRCDSHCLYLSSYTISMYICFAQRTMFSVADDKMKTKAKR